MLLEWSSRSCDDTKVNTLIEGEETKTTQPNLPNVSTPPRLTDDELPLLLDDLVTEVPVPLEAAHHRVLLADDVVPEEGARLHLCVLHLQLVHLAEQAEHLALLLGAHLARQQLLQAPRALPLLQEPSLQQHLQGGGAEVRGQRSKGHSSLSVRLAEALTIT